MEEEDDLDTDRRNTKVDDINKTQEIEKIEEAPEKKEDEDQEKKEEEGPEKKEEEEEEKEEDMTAAQKFKRDYKTAFEESKPIERKRPAEKNDINYDGNFFKNVAKAVLKPKKEEDKGKKEEEQKELPLNTQGDFDKIKAILFDHNLAKHTQNKMCHSCYEVKVSEFKYHENPNKDSTIIDKCGYCEAPDNILKKGLFKCPGKDCEIKICW